MKKPLGIQVCFIFFSCRYSLPDSRGGICDLLAFSLDSNPSSWSTLASPKFNIYEKNRNCDLVNNLNLDKELPPKARILTGKTPIVNRIQALPWPSSQPSSAQFPQFSGMTGNSFYQVQSIDRPNRPEYRPQFSPRPVKIPNIPPPVKAEHEKPVYQPVLSDEIPEESSNQKIQLSSSNVAALLLGNDGKK